jgi:hypothetical protein
MFRARVAAAAAAVALMAASLGAQQPGSVPRLADGKPDFSGVWWSGGIGVKQNTLEQLERLYKPEARAIKDKLTEDDDPTLRCIPFGYPRSMTLPANQQFQIVRTPGLMVILNEYFHGFRAIPTVGRPHPEDIVPTYLGDSEGRWEGDTLVVDVTGFNGQIWLAGGNARPTPTSTSGWFTTDALHIVERWRLVDKETLEYQATVEDSKILTGPWTTPVIRVKRAPEVKIREAMCLDTTTYSLTPKGQQERSKP